MAHDAPGYQLSPRARNDLEEIWLYTRDTWSMQQADDYIGALAAACARLADHSAIGQAVDIREGYLKYILGAHVIYFRVSASGIVIIRILHQRMDTRRYFEP